MRFVSGIFLVWLAASVYAFGSVITDVSFSQNQQITDVSFTFDNSRQPVSRVFLLDGKTPRIVVDLSDRNTQVSKYIKHAGPHLISGRGHVEGIRYARQLNGNLRLVLDLKPGAALDDSKTFPNRINVRVKGPFLPNAQALTVKSNGQDFDVPTPRVQPRKQGSARYSQAADRKIIVIDPGHGGRDPGAIGAKGTKEKDITLKAAIELRNQLLATRRYHVILTRDGDAYVDHEDRLLIARERGADLFISIHADSTKSRSVRGASVYTLADRARHRTREIVSNQNWIMDVDLSQQTDPVGDILVDLAQRKTTSQSSEFAKELVSQVSRKSQMVNNSHRRAGYFVLLAPDVPAVLLELGFISNTQDEKLLRTSAHRQKVMRSVTSAINRYFDRQNP